MKKLLLTLSILISISSFGADKISCVCNADVGYPGVLESEETINISVDIDSTGSSEASKAEIDIVVAYKCLQDKNDVRKIYKLNFIKCDM